MKKHLDKAKYANQKNISVLHYLVKLIDEILKVTDTNSRGEKNCSLTYHGGLEGGFDWQCSKLGINSLIKCGVKPALIPLLINYFKYRQIIVKWHGKNSETRSKNGGEPLDQSLVFWNI